MKKWSLLRGLTCSLIAAIVSCVSLTSVAQAAHVTAENSGQTVDIHQLIGALPLWQFANKVPPATTTASPQQIPPCLNNPTPSAAAPRCYSPQQIRNAYGVNGLLNAGITGKGQTIVIVSASSSPTIQSDLHFYDQLYGLPDPVLNVIAPFGEPTFDPGIYVETALDVQTAHSLAPDATIDVVLTGDVRQDKTIESIFVDLLKPVRYAVDNNLGSVISISYGAGESCFDSAYLQAEHDLFAAADAKHISVLASSGDQGAAVLSCSAANDPNAKFFYGAGTLIPASDPLVTSVGGTALDASVESGQYNNETTWNDVKFGASASATGGGFSSSFPRPDYQVGVVGNRNARGLPDISWDADPLTGVPIVISVAGATQIVPVGGTSVGAPAWGGIVVLFNQHAGKSLGFLNPTLYSILHSASYGSAFHDITTGNNAVTGFDVDGKSTSITGFSADIGWDAVTGIGTPKVTNLAGLLK